MLTELAKASQRRQTLFTDTEHAARRIGLMGVVDGINARMRRGSWALAAKLIR